MARSLAKLPARFPVGSKYVLELCYLLGTELVLRYVEFPDGRRVRLNPRRFNPAGNRTDRSRRRRLPGTAFAP